MSIQSARKQAARLVAELDIAQAPVNVAKVAEYLGISVASMVLDDDVSGLLITKPDMSCIVINESHHPVRQRFSIAHEIGHYYLNHQFEPGEHVHVDRGHRISHRNSRSSTGQDLKEIEANQFAACLLMPETLITESLKAFPTSELYDGDIPKLAREFNVSEQAMTIRLTTLGLL